MSKFLKILISVVAIAIFATGFLVFERPIAAVPGWPPSIQRSSKLYGMLKVKDTESGTTLFWYHSDPDAHPVRIEKTDANHWVVVFERVPK
ncbi:MAG TPA: hypothetical protein VGO68_20825 [Pyrinomonadaceae bacterium]|jgi:hypothetical protein|nr:hypothetical protein [Pyrinomonadaceae bacterium]